MRGTNTPINEFNWNLRTEFVSVIQLTVIYNTALTCIRKIINHRRIFTGFVIHIYSYCTANCSAVSWLKWQPGEITSVFTFLPHIGVKLWFFLKFQNTTSDVKIQNLTSDIGIASSELYSARYLTSPSLNDTDAWWQKPFDVLSSFVKVYECDKQKASQADTSTERISSHIIGPTVALKSRATHGWNRRKLRSHRIFPSHAFLYVRALVRVRVCVTLSWVKPEDTNFLFR